MDLTNFDFESECTRLGLDKERAKLISELVSFRDPNMAAATDPHVIASVCDRALKALDSDFHDELIATEKRADLLWGKTQVNDQPTD